MNPFYFGSGSAPLFGAYHAPTSPEVRSSGVVLCYPFGPEYMRSHRAFRQLATHLSDDGHHVLRFDYHGTGDSAGAADEVALDQCLEDISTAVKELRDTAAVPHVSLVGLRLGGALAAQLATTRNDLDTVVLWNPVVNGRAYTEELIGMADVSATAFSSRSGGESSDTATIGVGGFPLTHRLRRDLASVDLIALSKLKAKRFVLMVSDEGDEYLRLAEHVREQGVQCDYRCVPNVGNWSEVDEFVSALLPREMLQHIVTSIGRVFDGP